MLNITFLPSGKVAQVPAGQSILQAAISAGVQVISTCGGKGTCGKCRVQITTGTPSQMTEIEKKFLKVSEWEAGWTLACQHILREDTTVRVQELTDAIKRKTDFAGKLPVKIKPSVKKFLLNLAKPSVEDQTPDWERLMAALPSSKISFNRTVAASLPQVFRKGGFQVTAVLAGERILAVEPGDTTQVCYGAAIDVGTTTVVVYLMDLNTGTVIKSGALTNPQQVFGADVISRITHAAKGPDQLRELQERVVRGLNKIIAGLCQESEINKEEIYTAVVVGNTTMAHLFLGIDPTFLAPSPFIPAFRAAVEVQAGELGLEILRSGTVRVLPNIAGYVGSDTVGVMLAVEADMLAGINLIVDIGTNGEIVLCGKERMLTCSAAAGPAFEGAEIKFGMRAAAGAVEGVRIAEDVQLEVIGGTKPQGLCGSGLIDAIAEMHKAGVIGRTGRFASENEQEKLPVLIRQRLRKSERAYEFVLVWGKDSATGEDIVLTQKDIREMQLAKGAIMAGIRILCREMGIELQEIEQILLAGAFGNYIRKESAVEIGLLPSLPLEKILSIGNAAGDGAKMALLSLEERKRADELSKRAEHVELSSKKEFQQEFLKGLDFGIVQ
ncbi:putative metal-binding protein [Desulfosporosinus orientis DSM 765]|uniref:Putative metal-binding protein n=1 Tax=Desulfosporosinus orientis (strain ATCC 19365 / DSM 765 / NCIMB 8382 / VKM B-1628 / Singapore I) TaxID=768706 RepID=G7WBY3_DESOD|nr:ASKHA domain-containing protein [Desulfosporosinus orientis]AET69380.1 putative metal-binding protein [Desulfosporosinus orientis DSM 765]